jgi:DNA-binding XRE family transcriptional regulator
MARQKRLAPRPSEIFPYWPDSQMDLSIETHLFEPAALACEVSYQIKERRTELNWSRAHLGKIARISEFTIFNLENGKNWADLYTVGTLFDALGIRFEDLGRKKWPERTEQEHEANSLEEKDQFDIY